MRFANLIENQEMWIVFQRDWKCGKILRDHSHLFYHVFKEFKMTWKEKFVDNKAGMTYRCMFLMVIHFLFINRMNLSSDAYVENLWINCFIIIQLNWASEDTWVIDWCLRSNNPLLFFRINNTFWSCMYDRISYIRVDWWTLYNWLPKHENQAAVRVEAPGLDWN